MTNIELLDEVLRLCDIIDQVGGVAYVVGGAARDIYRNKELAIPLTLKDVDIEVFGMEPQALEDLLKGYYRIDSVGKAFEVIKLHGQPIDISVPRREVKTGDQHKDFVVTADPFMSVEEAASRRDFTINAIYYNPLTFEWLDPFNGGHDCVCKILRPVSSRFVEDPLRVLRGMQFIARFDLTPSEQCLAVCRILGQEHLPRERVWEEWKKMILHGMEWHKAMDFLLAIGWMQKYYPEIYAMRGSLQNPVWHPEGDCYEHFCLVMEAFARGVFKDDEEKLVLGLAALCHDLGKPATAEFKGTKNNPDPHWTNFNHETHLEPTYSFLARLTNETKLVEQVCWLVKSHMKPMAFYYDSRDKPGKPIAARPDLAAVRRLACNVNLCMLAKLVRFDQGGRGPTMPPEEDALAWFLHQAEAAKVLYSKPTPLILGRDLIQQFALAPGKKMGEILKVLMEKQLSGEFSTKEEGLVIAAKLVNPLE